VAAHRAQPGAGLADVAAQQQEVDDLLDRGHGVAVLGEAHRPADDRRSRRANSARGRLDLLARQAGRAATSSQSSARRCAADSSKPGGVLGDELVVDGVRVEQQPAERLEEREVAVEPDLQEQVGERGALADDARAALRVLERISPASGSGLTR
jgi:hypothetical protein